MQAMRRGSQCKHQHPPHPGTPTFLVLRPAGVAGVEEGAGGACCCAAPLVHLTAARAAAVRRLGTGGAAGGAGAGYCCSCTSRALHNTVTQGWQADSRPLASARGRHCRLLSSLLPPARAALAAANSRCSRGRGRGLRRALLLRPRHRLHHTCDVLLTAREAATGRYEGPSLHRRPEPAARGRAGELLALPSARLQLPAHHILVLQESCRLPLRARLPALAPLPQHAPGPGLHSQHHHRQGCSGGIGPGGHASGAGLRHLGCRSGSCGSSRGRTGRSIILICCCCRDTSQGGAVRPLETSCCRRTKPLRGLRCRLQLGWLLLQVTTLLHHLSSSSSSGSLGWRKEDRCSRQLAGQRICHRSRRHYLHGGSTAAKCSAAILC